MIVASFALIAIFTAVVYWPLSRTRGAQFARE
jgi:hypothetical protein